MSEGVVDKYSEDKGFGYVIGINIPFKGPHVVELINAQGKVATRCTGVNAANYNIPLAPAMYLVRVKVNGRKAFVKKIML